MLKNREATKLQTFHGSLIITQELNQGITSTKL